MDITIPAGEALSLTAHGQIDITQDDTGVQIVVTPEAPAPTAPPADYHAVVSHTIWPNADSVVFQNWPNPPLVATILLHLYSVGHAGEAAYRRGLARLDVATWRIGNGPLAGNRVVVGPGAGATPGVVGVTESGAAITAQVYVVGPNIGVTINTAEQLEAVAEATGTFTGELTGAVPNAPQRLPPVHAEGVPTFGEATPTPPEAAPDTEGKVD